MSFVASSVNNAKKMTIRRTDTRRGHSKSIQRFLWRQLFRKMARGGGGGGRGGGDVIDLSLWVWERETEGLSE